MHTPNDNLPKSVQCEFRHGIENEIIAKQKCVKAMNFKLLRNIVAEDIGLLIQSNLIYPGLVPHQMEKF